MQHLTHIKQKRSAYVGSILGVSLLLIWLLGGCGAEETTAPAEVETTEEAPTGEVVMGEPEPLTEITGTVELTPATETAIMGEPEPLTEITGTVELTPATETAAGQPEPLTETTAAVAEPAVRASFLLDYEIQNPAGESLGEIEDLIIGMESGQVTYAVLSFGGFLDIGDKQFVIPIGNFVIEPGRELVILDVDQEVLENAPGFEMETWPEITSPDWDLAYRDYWQDVVSTPGLTAGAFLIEIEAPLAEEPAIRASDLLGYPVINGRLQDLGEIEALMIGLESGQVDYAVLSFGGFLDIGDKLFAIPLDALEVDPVRPALVFDVSEEILEDAPGFDPDAWPDTANPRWTIDSSDYWRDAGYLATVGTTPTGPETRAISDPATTITALLAYDLIDAQGNSLGQIEDLMIGLPSGDITYAVLSFDEAVGLEEALYPVPWGTFILDPDQEGLILSAAELDVMAAAPNFAPGDWPQTTTTTWDAPIRSYWLSVTEVREVAVRASELITYNAMTTDRIALGNVEDLIVGFISNHVKYAVVVVETDEDAAPLYPVPWGLLTIDLDTETMLVDVEPALLQTAPRFAHDDWPAMAEPQWDVAYRSFWEGLISPLALAAAQVLPTDEAALRATRLLAYSVENPLQESLGEIEDLLIGRTTGRVEYAVLSFGGFLDFGEELFIIPLDLLEFDPIRSTLILDIDQTTLEAAPSFEPEGWPLMVDPEWDNVYGEFWENNIAAVEVDETETETASLLMGEPAIRASELLDYPVETVPEEAAGEIEDLMIGLDTTRINYAVLAFDDFLELGEDYFIFPFSVLVINDQNETVNLDVGQETFKDVPSFAPDRWPETAEPGWDLDVQEYWGNL